MYPDAMKRLLDAYVVVHVNEGKPFLQVEGWLRLRIVEVGIRDRHLYYETVHGPTFSRKRIRVMLEILKVVKGLDVRT
jgi:hypothetical protein